MIAPVFEICDVIKDVFWAFMYLEKAYYDTIDRNGTIIIIKKGQQCKADRE